MQHHRGECMFRKIYLLILLTSALALPASIKAQDTAPNHMPTPNFDLYGGYCYVFSESGTPPGSITTHGMNGWDASLKVPLFTQGSLVHIMAGNQGRCFRVLQQRQFT